jgi:uncharacterized membrane protein YjgN (DUF898 family)
MSDSAQKLEYHGTGGELFGIMLLNALLSIVTLGIYSFWGRTKVRDYLYSQTELAGDRFAYHGTGGELLRGWLKAFGILLLLFIILAAAFAVVMPRPIPGQPPEPTMALFAIQAAYMVILGTLVAIAINGSRRYRLSRSSWRGIRFSYMGRWQDFLALNIKGYLLSVITLSLYVPFYRNQSRGFLVDNARFGSMGFSYDADGKDLFVSYLKSLLLAIPTLGLSFVWYQAFQHRYFWSHTTLGPARLRSTVTGGALFGLIFTNILLVIFTLGIGAPWVATRTTRFMCDNLMLEGEIDWGTVEQQAQLASATGEGLAQGLDVDADLGLGM